jgi:N-acetylglucosamine-6-phosphate deacetylase
VNKSGVVAIESGTLYTPAARFSPGRIIIDNGVIADIGGAGEIRIPVGAHTVDASRLIVTPGFIDPHIHGCGGVDVMDGSYESLNAVSRIMARHGTTSFLPTTVSSPAPVLTGSIERLGELISKPFDGAQPLGIHLEGPFISPAKRGTHKASNVMAPDAELFERWIRVSKNTVRLITVAPELNGVLDVIRIARENGVTIGMGHSDATFEQAGAACSLGVCYAVHTFNAMRPLSHRDPGILGQVLIDETMFAEIIADGIHVDPAVVRLFARAKGKNRTVLITDAISATDMPDGNYRLGADTVNVCNGVCRDPEGRLAGSTLTQEIALRNFVQWTGWNFEDALLGLTLNPARALHLNGKGVLEVGVAADIAILDESFRVMKTFVAGKLVFERKAAGPADVAEGI